MGKKLYHKSIHRILPDLVMEYVNFKEYNYNPLDIEGVNR